MSLASLVPFEHVTPPRYDDVLHLSANHEIANGCSNVREIAHPSDQQTANSITPGTTSFTFNCADNLCIDRTILLKQKVQCTITASAIGTDVDFSELSGAALAAYPLSRCMDSITVSINGGAGKTYRPREYAPALRRYMDDKEMQRMNGLCPTQLDPYNNIAALQLAGGCGITGTEENGDGVPAATAVKKYPGNGPFSYLGKDFESRASFRTITDTFVAANASTASSHVRVYEVTEALPHQFFDWFATEDRTLARINQIQVTITWTNLNAMFVVGPSLVQNVTVVSAGVPTAWAGSTFAVNGFFEDRAYLLIRQSIPVNDIPAEIKFDYEDAVIQRYPIPGAMATFGHTPVDVNFPAIRVSQVPERMLIYAQRRNITTTNKPDCFLSIKNLSIDTDDNTGGLTSATPQHLYQMSVRNGYHGTYTDFSLNSGSVVCVDIRKGDLGGLIAGLMSPTTFNIKATVQNNQVTRFYNRSSPVVDPATATEDVDPDIWQFYVVMFMKGKLVLNGTTGQVEGGESISTVDTVFKTQPASPEGGGVRGGSIKSFFRSAYRKVIRPAWHWLAPQLKPLADAAKNTIQNVISHGVQSGVGMMQNAQHLAGAGVRPQLGYGMTGRGVRLS